MLINGPDRKKKEVDIDNSLLSFLLILLAILLALVLATVAYYVVVKTTSPQYADAPQADDKNDNGTKENNFPFKQEDITVDIVTAKDNPDSVKIEGISSEYAALIDLTDGKVIASQKSSSMIYPASMTKVMTLIVVCENLPNEDALNELLEIKHPRGEHYGYGFEIGEKVTVEDLMYAAILQSDGVACLTLADYIAGNEANFVKLMNEKVKEIGLLEGDPEKNPSTNFTNCTGLHDQYHYSTPYDIGVIMAYAMKNDLCAKIITSYSHNFSKNFRPDLNPILWHMLLHDPKYFGGKLNYDTVTISGGKTGWTGTDSGYCVVSYAYGKNGKEYILVTAKAKERTQSINDQIYIYNTYAN